MAELDAILQPEEFRPDGAVAAWAFFPRLRLLLGWGDGLWEALGDQMTAIRTLFCFACHAPPPVLEIGSFIAWLEAYDAERPPMPFYARMLGAASCQYLYANDICTSFAGPADHAHQGYGSNHPIEANANFRVAHGAHDDGRLWLSIEKRFKTLKPEFVAKMAELDLPHEHGTGKRSQAKPANEKRTRRQRNPDEQAFALHLTELKKNHVVLRVPELLLDASTRPPRFLVQMAELERVRMEAVARGKNDNNGLPYQPYSDEELLLATCHAVASAEATDLTFVYAWSPVCQFDDRGLTML
ncbi:MAG: hypothetical protein QY323_04075 [Patescibacteria group bacterium]|nr:MAG: hypothetical protein QY323_04075 [Patescibacteria group bacterium]